MKFLLDTDWIVKFLRGQRRIIKVMSSLYDEGFAISIISFSEIYEGIYRFEGRKRGELEENFKNFLAGVQVLHIDEHIGKIFAEQRARLRRENKLIDNFDLLIGATALCHDLELLTDNIKHFERIDNLKLHSLDDFAS